MLLFHWWPVRSWPDRGQQSLSSLFHHHGELCSRLESGRSLAPYCGTWIACVKKERKRKKERNPGKIQLARDPTASDDACPRPILGWPVYLPQPLAGARITEKRRRRPNHVTRFPSVRSACLLLFLVLYTTLLLLLCIRLHLLDMYKLAPLPNFSPSTPRKQHKTCDAHLLMAFSLHYFWFFFRISFLHYGWRLNRVHLASSYTGIEPCLNHLSIYIRKLIKMALKQQAGTSTGKPIHKSQERRTSKAILFSEWLSHREKEE